MLYSINVPAMLSDRPCTKCIRYFLLWILGSHDQLQSVTFVATRRIPIGGPVGPVSKAMHRAGDNLDVPHLWDGASDDEERHATS